MLISEVLEKLESYLRPCASSSGLTWYKPKDDYVLIMSGGFFEADHCVTEINVYSGYVKFSFGDDDTDPIELKADDDCSFQFTVHKISDPILVI